MARCFRELSDAELLLAVGERHEDYTEHALELAWAELRSRGVQSPPVGYREPLPAEEPPAPKVRAGRGTRWLGIYPALVGAWALGGPFAQLLLGSSLADIALQLPVSALGVAVAYGLIKRRLWGWYLNWILLVGFVMLSALLARAGAGTLIWVAVNGYYFARRRRLFS